MTVIRSLISLIFILTFCPSTNAAIGSPVPKRPVALYSGLLFPLDQFWPAFPDVCPFIHFHAASGGMVTAFDGTVIPDPEPNGCGYGLLGVIFIGEAYETDLPDQDFDGIPDSLDPDPLSPDSNSNGIPDGSEDTDGDGLSLGDEIWVTQSDPTKADTDGAGFDDKFDYILSTTQPEFTKIPFVVNLYKGSGATDQHAREAMALANSVLKKARLMFVLAKVNADFTEGDDGSGGGTAEDANFTEAEGRKVAGAGHAEIAGLSGKKGFKVAFAQPGGVETGSTTPGISYHRWNTVICEQRASTQLSAATIAHELFHVLTLKHPAPGTPEDTPGNIMTPSDAGRDDFVNSPDADKGLANVSLTPGQIAQIQADGVIPNLGRTGTFRSPARKKQYEVGFNVDAAGDQTPGQPGYLDLLMLQANADEDRTDVLLMLSFNGLIPESGAFSSIFRLLVDADDNQTTGSTVAGVPGVDRDIQIIAHREEGEPLELLTRMFELPSFTRQALPNTPIIRPVTRRGDEGTIADEVFTDLLEFNIAKSAFGFSADQVPVTVISQADEFGAVVDSMSFVYNREQYLDDPTMTVMREFVEPDASISFTLEGLTPDSAFELFVDETLVLSDVLDSNGEFTGAFNLPPDLPDDFYFLAAQDSAGEFAFSAVFVRESFFESGFEEGLGSE